MLHQSDQDNKRTTWDGAAARSAVLAQRFLVQRKWCTCTLYLYDIRLIIHTLLLILIRYTYTSVDVYVYLYLDFNICVYLYVYVDIIIVRSIVGYNYMRGIHNRLVYIYI